MQWNLRKIFNNQRLNNPWYYHRLMQRVFKIKNRKIEIFSTSQEGSNSDSVDGFWIIKKTYQARKTFIIVWDSVPKNDLRVLQKHEIKKRLVTYVTESLVWCNTTWSRFGPVSWHADGLMEERGESQPCY